MAAFTKEQLEEIIEQLQDEREAAANEAADTVRKSYSSTIDFFRKKLAKLSPEPLFLRPRVLNGAHSNSEVEVKPIPPGARGAISAAVRKFVQTERREFTLEDLMEYVGAQGIDFNPPAVTATIKRMMKDGDVRRVRRGTNKTRALFEPAN